MFSLLVTRVVLYSLGSIKERWIAVLRSFGYLFSAHFCAEMCEKACGVSASVKAAGSKPRAAWRHLKAKRCLHFAMFLSVAVTYATSMVSRGIWTKERSFTWWKTWLIHKRRLCQKFSNVQGNVFVSLLRATTHHFKA